MIIDETYKFLITHHKELTERLFIEEARLGLHLSAVRLSDKSYGVAGTLTDNHCFCKKNDRDFGAFTPNRITGRKITELFETPKVSCVIETLKIAALNAISSTLLLNGNYKITEDADPIDLLDLTPEKTVTIVGAFQSYIQKISKSGNRLFVVEFNEHALHEEHKRYYVPASDFKKVIPGSDIVIITGLTLVNHTIDELLETVTPGTKTIVTGPSSSIIPDILFKNKVNIIGATRFFNKELIFPIVSEFGTGFHLFKYCAQKICILNEPNE